MAHGVKKCAYFRFYAELNDFLPVQKRQVKFSYHFWGTPSIKNAIQALGVPHTEIDLILIDGKPVDFSYHLKPQDNVSVYPVFEMLNISEINPLRNKPLRDLRFIVDVNIGKLARYMRMLGFDTLYNNQFEDPEIIRISNNEKRIILTHDLEILKHNRVARGYYLRSQDPNEQLQEVIQKFDLLSEIAPFSRCMECNGKMEAIDKNEIRTLVEEDTWEIFTDFYQCNSCKKIYWKGSHYERMNEMINALGKH